MAEDNQKDQEDKIDAGFRGVNARLDTLAGHVTALDGRVEGVDGRMHALAGRVDARLDTVDTGLADVRADLGNLKAHVFEIRDALFADNVKNREHVSVQVDALRSELKVYAEKR